jgi:hypothetical protein
MGVQRPDDDGRDLKWSGRSPAAIVEIPASEPGTLVEG